MRISGETPSRSVVGRHAIRHELFVGRVTELSLLGAAQPPATILLGEPGAGKTRLLAEASGMRSFWRQVTIGCHRGAEHVPLEPLLSVARALVAHQFATVADGDSVLSSAESDRLPAIRDVIERAVSVAPLLIQVDDLHWADAQTLEALWYCVDRLQDVEVRWHFAGRAGDHKTERLAGQLERSSLGRAIQLTELPLADFATLTSLLSGHSIDESQADRLHGLTGGNPLYLEQFLAAESSAPDGLTPSLRLLLDDRIRSLSGNTLQVARALAIRGEISNVGTLSRLTELSHDEVSLAIIELESQVIAKTMPVGCAFRHELLRQACYRLTPEEIRTRLHLSIAENSTDPWRLAHHLDGAGRAEEAARVLLRHGTEKIDNGDPVEAQAALNGSISRDTRGTGISAEATAGLAVVKAHFGDESAAAELMRRFEALSQRLNVSQRVASRCRFAEAVFDTSDDCTAAQPYLQLALSEVSPATASWSPRLLGLAGAMADRMELPQRARELLVEGLAACGPHTRPRDSIRLKSWLGVVLGRLGEPLLGLATLRDAAELAEEHRLSAELAQCCVKGCYLADMLGDQHDYEKWCRRGLDIRGPRERRVTAVLRLNLATVALDKGSLQEGLGMAAAAATEAELGGVALRAQTMCALALAYAMLGSFTEAAEAVSSAQRLRLNARWHRAVGFVAGRVSELAQDLPGALAHYKMVESESALADAVEGFDVRALAGIVRVLYRLRRKDELQVAAARLRDKSLPAWPLVESLRAESAGFEQIAIGDVEPGVALLLIAANSAKEHFRAAALFGFAGIARVDRQLINQSIAEFELMGADRAAERVRAAAREIGLRPRSRPRVAGEFTTAEQRVAVLVGAGKTNSEIANQIGLSAKTVEHYVSSILSKRNLRSRVQLAAAVASGTLFETPTRDDRGSQLNSI